MRNFINALLGKKSVAASAVREVSDASSAPRAIEAFLDEEIERFQLFSPEGREIVQSHFRTVLALQSNSEGKSLKEVRAAISVAKNLFGEQVGEVVGPELTKQQLLSAVQELYNKATIRKARIDQVIKMRGVGIKEMVLMNSGTGNECEWCKRSEGSKFSVDEDVDALLSKNCTCRPYPGCVFNAVVNV